MDHEPAANGNRGKQTDAQMRFPVSISIRRAAFLSFVAFAAVFGGLANLQPTQAVSTGSPTTTTITALPVNLFADGVSFSHITVQVKDSSSVNVTVGGDAVVISTTLGSLGSVVDHQDGRYSASLTSTATGTATITGTLNGVTISDSTSVAFWLESDVKHAFGINFYAAGHIGTIQNLTITVTSTGALNRAIGIRTASSPTIQSNVISAIGDIAAGIASEWGSPTIQNNVAVSGKSTGTPPFDPYYDSYDPYYDSCDPDYDSYDPYYDPYDPYYDSYDPYYDSCDAYYDSYDPYHDPYADAAISGEAAAIVLEAGSATITGNAISNSLIGVAIVNTATASISSNTFTGNDIGIFIECSTSSAPTISLNSFAAADSLDIGIRWHSATSTGIFYNTFSGYGTDRAELLARCS